MSVFCDDSMHVWISLDGTIPIVDLRKVLLMLDGSRRILNRQNKTGRVARTIHYQLLASHVMVGSQRLTWWYMRCR